MTNMDASGAATSAAPFAIPYRYESGEPPMPKKELPNIEDATSMITIAVEENGEVTKLLVHKDVVFHRCPIIKNAVESSGTPYYQFTEATPKAVQLFFQWLYFQEITVRQLRGDLSVEDNRTECTEEDITLVELWALAENLRLPDLQNVAIKAIDDVFNSYCEPNYAVIARAYSLTTPDCQLRKFFVACCIESGLPESKVVDEWSKEILLDLTKEAFNKLDQVDEHFCGEVKEFYCTVEET